MTRALTRRCILKMKKSTYPIMEFSIFRPCSQVLTSGVEMSTEAETLPVCSIFGLSAWAEFLRKWPQHLRGDAFWKLKKSSSPIMTGDMSLKVDNEKSTHTCTLMTFVQKLFFLYLVIKRGERLLILLGSNCQRNYSVREDRVSSQKKHEKCCFFMNCTTLTQKKILIKKWTFFETDQSH